MYFVSTINNRLTIHFCITKVTGRSTSKLPRYFLQIVFCVFVYLLLNSIELSRPCEASNEGT